jgi:hypothetical protein
LRQVQPNRKEKALNKLFLRKDYVKPCCFKPAYSASSTGDSNTKSLRIYSTDLLHNNETFHQYLIEKVKIPYQQDGYERSHEVALIDFDNWQNNTFLDS